MKPIRILFVLQALILGIGFSHTTHALSPGEEGLSPEIAQADLKAGNVRFVSGQASHKEQDEATRKALATGQHPEAIILSCSDSRVPPELVFDQGLGRLFTIRVAGNIAEPATVASIEYAALHLGARLIVVMGHESCGAVKAALETPAGKSAGSHDLDFLIGQVRRNIAARGATTPDAKAMELAVQTNAVAVARSLTEHSKVLRTAVATKKVAIVPAVYHLATGMVEFFDTVK